MFPMSPLLLIDLETIIDIRIMLTNNSITVKNKLLLVYLLITFSFASFRELL